MSEAVATPPPAPQATPPVPVPAPTPAAPAPDFAARMKAEQEKRATQARERETTELRTRLTTLEAQAKEAAEHKAWREQAIKDPGKLADLYGDKWYDTLTESRLNGGRLTPEQVDARLESKLSEFEAKQKAKESEEADAKKAATAAAHAEWVEDLKLYVESEPKSYRLIAKHAQPGDVAALIERNYRETGKLMSNAEGAKAMEDHLRKAILDSIDDDLYQEIQKSRQPANPSASATREVPKSLHNGLSASTPGTPPRLSREQRKAAAVKKLEEMEAAGKTGA